MRTSNFEKEMTRLADNLQSNLPQSQESNEINLTYDDAVEYFKNMSEYANFNNNDKN